MRILIWHVHGSWATSFVQGPHDYLVPVNAERNAVKPAVVLKVEGRLPRSRAGPREPVMVTSPTSRRARPKSIK